MTTQAKKHEDIKKGNLIELCNEISRILFIAFLLAVAYSATIGGLSSLVGTAPNIFVKGYSDK
jgi:di/tricarboxylate transporter